MSQVQDAVVIPVATKTFYVSAGFSGIASPFFSTITAALAACDGVTATTIYVYQGIYTEAITMKNAVSLIGIDPIKSVVFQSANGSICCTIVPAAGQSFQIENIGFLNTGNPGVGIEVQAGTGVAQINLMNVYATGTLGSGVHIVNSNSFAHNFSMERSTLTGTSGTAGAFNFQAGSTGATFVVRDCAFYGSDQVYQCVGFVYERCSFFSGVLKVPDAGFDKTYVSCYFGGGTNIAQGAFADATLKFSNCTMEGFSAAVSGGAGQLFFDLCRFKAAAADGNIFDISGGTGKLRLRNCILENGKINFSAVMTGYLIVTDTSIRNPGGALSLASGANVMTFVAFNLTTDKALGANITVAAGGVNNNIAVAI